MENYEVNCEELSTFLEVVVSLMKAGACFEANADALTIKLTGGY
jgi:hypothetical protein